MLRPSDDSDWQSILASWRTAAALWLGVTTATVGIAGWLLSRSEAARRADRESHDLERELSRMLAAGGGDVPCPIDLAQLRQLVIDYLTDYDTELAQLPEQMSEPHWNLNQWDESGEFDRDSYFVALVVRPTGLEFACGHGPQLAVREFADSDFPDDVDEVIPELGRRFTLPLGSVRVSRAAAEAWIGRELRLLPI